MGTATKATTYEIPQAVAIALSTDRVQFLAGLTHEELVASGDCVQLLRDLIEDRVKLNQKVNKLILVLESTASQARSAAASANRLIEILQGATDLDGGE